MNIVAIESTSPYMAAVRELWRTNSSTLGFFPDIALLDYAARKRILVAIDETGDCLGYLLWRTSFTQVRIVHLCIKKQHRGKGAARRLVERLRQDTRQWQGIGLWCRRDFSASAMWPKLGFVAWADKVGRSQDGKYLTFWWLDYGHPNLFAYDAARDGPKLRVAIDTNIFLDLWAHADKPAGIESRALMSDWLQDHLELCITDEVLNEVGRHPHAGIRKRLRTYAEAFPRVSPCWDDVTRSAQALEALNLSLRSASDRSDVLHLARAVAGHMQFFVTRDDPLLSAADAVYDGCGLRLVRPCDLILHLDELLEGANYQPVRLGGSRIEMSRVKSRQHKTLDMFRLPTELKTSFQQRLREFLANCIVFENSLVRDSGGNPLALVTYRRCDNELQVPLMRVLEGPLGSTVARYLVFHSICLAARECRALTRFTDHNLQGSCIESLRRFGFTQTSGTWVKLNLRAIGVPSGLAEAITLLGHQFPNESGYLKQLVTGLEMLTMEADPTRALLLEDLIWPAKLMGMQIPCFMIPIRPRWAQELFDEGLANQTLWGARPELVLNCESVYYRAKSPGIVLAPGRVVWYVSHDKHYADSKHVRACSRLDEVVIGRPRELYRRFRRLGVYEWDNVFQTASYNLERDIMAIRFSNTELFRKPIPYNALHTTLLGTEQRGFSIRAPMRISEEAFAYLYGMGMCLREGT